MITKLIILVCAIGLSSAGVLGTDYSDATLVSYSKISSSPSFPQINPVENVPESVPQYITKEPLKPVSGNQYSFEKSSSIGGSHVTTAAPLYTEAITDSGIDKAPLRSSFDLSSPEPTPPLSVKVTPGLSAYASNPYVLANTNQYSKKDNFEYSAPSPQVTYTYN